MNTLVDKDGNQVPVHDNGALILDERTLTIGECTLLVEGLENWISELIGVSEPSDLNSDMLRVKDSKTGAVFLIRRVE